MREWEEACAKGDLGLCAEVGESYAKGIGVAQDYAKAANVYREACERDGARACMLLGLAHLSGQGVSKDEAQASQFLGKSCDLGDKNGCAHACDDVGDAIRCLRVGLLAGRGGTDLPRAVAYYRKACDRGHPLGCREAAIILGNGVGATNKDTDRAAELYKKADEMTKVACSRTKKPDFCEP